MGKLLSVIVPIYNVEPYIRQCVESIINQTYKNLEIILVDDGSPDNCGAICDEYAAKDGRIKVIHQKNAGVSAARNYGLRICTGDYIALIDSDDYILPTLCEECMQVAEKDDFDYIGYGHFTSGEGNGGSGKLTVADPHEEWLNSLKYEGTLAWGMIIKKEIWNGIFYPEGRFFEDSVVVYQILERVKSMVRIDRELYFYRKNPTGTCQSSVFKPKNRYGYVLSCLDRLAYAEEKNVAILECRTALLKSIMSYFTAFYGMSEKENSQYREAMVLLKKHREMPYDTSLLNGKYKIYLWCAGRMDFVHKIGGKFSVWAKKAKVLIGK